MKTAYPALPPVLIWTCVLKHIIQSGTLLFCPEADAAANTAVLLALTPRPLLIAVMLGAALLAAMACWRRYVASVGVTFACLIPQQLLLFASAGGTIYSIIHGTWPNGTPAARALIFQSQSGFLLFAGAHFVAMTLLLRRLRNGN